MARDIEDQPACRMNLCVTRITCANLLQEFFCFLLKAFTEVHSTCVRLVLSYTDRTTWVCPDLCWTHGRRFLSNDGYTETDEAVYLYGMRQMVVRGVLLGRPRHLFVLPPHPSLVRHHYTTRHVRRDPAFLHHGTYGAGWAAFGYKRPRLTHITSFTTLPLIPTQRINSTKGPILVVHTPIPRCSPTPVTSTGVYHHGVMHTPFQSGHYFYSYTS